MAIPDLWIKILKHVSDEDWPIGEIVIIFLKFFKLKLGSYIGK